MCNCGKSKAKRKVRPHSRLIKGNNRVEPQPMVEKKIVTETQPVFAPEEKRDVPSET